MFSKKNAKIVGLVSCMLVIGICLPTVGSASIQTIKNNGKSRGPLTEVVFNPIEDQVDQQQLEHNYTDLPNESDIYGWAIYDEDFGFAQSFIPTLPVLTRVRLSTASFNNPSFNLIASVRSSLHGNDLTSVIKSANEVGNLSVLTEYDLPDILVDPGQTYFIVLRVDGTTGENFSCYAWGFGENTSYTNGEGMVVGDPDDRSDLIIIGDTKLLPLQRDNVLEWDQIFETYGTEYITLGDMDGNGIVNFGDINPFVLAMSNPIQYQTIFHLNPNKVGDLNHDGILNFGDINPFVELLTGG